ncbi:MAG: class IV adenylate cyclase [Acidobacteria bacterium]|nr:class IV adenylate cyclase [Acidobacteriota bacterium]MBI3421705.1 class IV adenylate cyclase [Acidobacteriota bacterium]
MPDPHEIEVKLRYDSVAPLERAGLQLTLETPRHFEDNWLLDTAARQLSQRAAILRVRQVNGTGTLTFKERAAPDAAATQFKARVEIETPIGDPASTLALLGRLGYRQWFRYQKYRTVYRAGLPSGAELHVMFDETPLGNFIELEGAEEALAEAVQRLGVRRAEYILESYLALQINVCRALGRELEDMIF